MTSVRVLQSKSSSASGLKRSRLGNRCWLAQSQIYSFVAGDVLWNCGPAFLPFTPDAPIKSETVTQFRITSFPQRFEKWCFKVFNKNPVEGAHFWHVPERWHLGEDWNMNSWTNARITCISEHAWDVTQAQRSDRAQANAQTNISLTSHVHGSLLDSAWKTDILKPHCRIVKF